MLPSILAVFKETFPRIQVELRCALSTPTVDSVRKGEVDVALVTRMNNFTGGLVVHQEQLVWIVGEHSQAQFEDPVRLALLPPGNIYREHAIEHIERAGRKWQIACVSESVSGLQAAVFAGMAVTVLCRCALVSRYARAHVRAKASCRCPRLICCSIRRRERLRLPSMLCTTISPTTSDFPQAALASSQGLCQDRGANRRCSADVPPRSKPRRAFPE